MSDKMMVIVNKTTGHVLAAATRRSEPETAAAIEDLVDDGLEINDPESGDRWLTVDPEQMEVKVVDYDENVLIRPRAYQLQDDVPVLLALSISTISLSSSELSISFTFPTGETPPIWIQLENGARDERIVLTEAAATAAPHKFAQQFNVGNAYEILALVGFNTPLTTKLTVS